jgi:hypothetical protein
MVLTWAPKVVRTAFLPDRLASNSFGIMHLAYYVACMINTFACRDTKNYFMING